MSSQPVPSWIEKELNDRCPVVAANRCATYAAPDGVSVRFLYAQSLERTALHQEPMIEITNLAHVHLMPSVAKRLVVDLRRAIAQYEERMGSVLTLQELYDRWDVSSSNDARAAPPYGGGWVSR
jgi:hypothetical protein